MDRKLSEIGKNDENYKRLMTVPDVGIITAITYKVTLDCPERFERSEIVGAYLGLTPRQYASGDVDRHGSISKMGPKECRTLLYEAALSFVTRVKMPSKLKTWGLNLAKKKGMKTAIVAVARKLAVLMHRMLVSKKDFCYK
jgi:transposase